MRIELWILETWIGDDRRELMSKISRIVTYFNRLLIIEDYFVVLYFCFPDFLSEFKEKIRLI